MEPGDGRHEYGQEYGGEDDGLTEELGLSLESHGVDDVRPGVRTADVGEADVVGGEGGRVPDAVARIDVLASVGPIWET